MRLAAQPTNSGFCGWSFSGSSCPNTSLVWRSTGHPLSTPWLPANPSPLGFQSTAVLDLTRINVPLTLRKRGVETKLLLASSNAASSFDPTLVALIARAHCYLRKLTKKPGRSLTDVAAECGTEPSEVSRILPLAFLAPAIVEAVLAGRQPISLTTQRLLRVRDVPATWAKQAALLLESRTSNH